MLRGKRFELLDEKTLQRGIDSLPESFDVSQDRAIRLTRDRELGHVGALVQLNATGDRSHIESSAAARKHRPELGADRDRAFVSVRAEYVRNHRGPGTANVRTTRTPRDHASVARTASP